MVTLDRGTEGHVEVVDLSRSSILAVAARVEASITPEAFVYRETEMDVLWKLADTAWREAQGPDQTERAFRRRSLIHLAHDILGENEDALAAAIALRKAAVA